MIRISNNALFQTGLCSMAVALCLQTITLANGRYGAILLVALALTILADASLAVLAWRGGVVWRIVATALMLPTIFIVGDFIRRIHSIF